VLTPYLLIGGLQRHMVRCSQGGASATGDEAAEAKLMQLQ